MIDKMTVSVYQNEENKAEAIEPSTDEVRERIRNMEHNDLTGESRPIT